MKQLRLFTLLLVLVGTFGYFGFQYSQPPLAGMAQKGVLDLRKLESFEQQVSLSGEWEFYWQRLLTEAGKGLSPVYISYPSIWNNIEVNGRKLPSMGYGTYALTLLLPKERPVLALDMPDNYCAYAFYANGKLLAKNGEVGPDAETSKPYFVSRILQLPAGVDSISIAIQAAN